MSPARYGTKASGTNPKALGTNPRARGTNPRAKGTNPKALGTNPCALGTNPRALGLNPRALGIANQKAAWQRIFASGPAPAPDLRGPWQRLFDSEAERPISEKSRDFDPTDF